MSKQEKDKTNKNKPIYVTSPLMPEIDLMQQKIKEIWDSKWITNNGKQLKEFEKKLQSHLKVPFLSLLNNGTTALILALKALDLSGDIITTPFTFPATSHAITWSGMTPIFCDIDPLTLNIDVNKIEESITPQTTGILAVHIFGTPCNVEKIQEIADKHKLKVIYDAAHSFGVEIDGQGIGNFGDISMMSFHATKTFHSAEGGALCFKDNNLASKINLLKNFGIRDEETVLISGINGKMSELHAALGLLVLARHDEEIKNRKILINTYKNLLKEVEGISFLEVPQNIKSNYQYSVIKINEKVFGRSRHYVYEKLKEHNIFTRKYFYPLCSNYPHYKNLPSANPEKLPIAQKLSKEILCLPLYGSLPPKIVKKICDMIISFRKETFNA